MRTTWAGTDPCVTCNTTGGKVRAGTRSPLRLATPAGRVCHACYRAAQDAVPPCDGCGTTGGGCPGSGNPRPARCRVGDKVLCKECHGQWRAGLKMPLPMVTCFHKALIRARWRYERRRLIGITAENGHFGEAIRPPRVYRQHKPEAPCTA